MTSAALDRRLSFPSCCGTTLLLGRYMRVNDLSGVVMYVLDRES